MRTRLRLLIAFGLTLGLLAPRPAHAQDPAPVPPVTAEQIQQAIQAALLWNLALGAPSGGFAPLALVAPTFTLDADRVTGIYIPGNGGDGANGANASIFELDFSPAGHGSPGGAGDTVTPTVNFGPFDIQTSSIFGFGLFAQSNGGDGGNGGNNTTIFVGNGGNGGRGGNGGTIDLVTTSSTGGIFTTGLAGFGVIASSTGGDGGNGGNATAIDAEGGDGGRGGNGGTVTVTVNNFITTFGDHATAIFGQSLSGNGGNGGNGTGIVGGGGSGSGSGNGQTVTLTNNHSLFTAGQHAYGIFGQSVGGFSGGGGSGGGIVGFGGSTSSGGDGGLVSLTNTGSVITLGHQSHGLFGQSIGGDGGSAGGSIGAVALGASGSNGGAGRTVTATNQGQIVTAGDIALGIYAQSIGGGGGNGGSSGGLVALGGKGSGGGGGGAVTLTNAIGSSVSTAGSWSHALFAQSVGGGGGFGGLAGAGVAIGGSGSGGGSGSTVTLTNHGTVITTGAGAAGLFAQSIGGGGGAGAFSGGLISFGGRGSAGGTGGVVNVLNTGTLSTAGHAIYAQSVGGGGGSGGGSIGGQFSLGGSSTAGGRSFTVTVTNSGTILAPAARGIFAQSVGGGGGDGGFSGGVLSIGGSSGGVTIGGAVTVTNAGGITSAGSAIFAQSVGGGGGNGGLSGGWLSFGGTGGGGGAASTVTVTNVASLATTGSFNASAIHAQSVGGGGGSGGGSVSAGYIASLGIGGKGSSGGMGGVVFAESNAPSITTSGLLSHGLFAQSVGGGGGGGGFAASLALSDTIAASVAVGGSGAAGGSASRVDAIARGDITASGPMSSGVFAQSVGGGGGAGGWTVSLAGGQVAGGLSFGGGGGPGGSGSIVDVTTTNGLIHTKGFFSFGVLAQSVGGGGGTGGFSVAGGFATAGAAALSLGGKGGIGGNGGQVDLLNRSSVLTEGFLSPALLAQSLGGGGGNGGFSIAAAGANVGVGAITLGGTGSTGGKGGAVTLDTDGWIETTGDLSFGALAQSLGGGGGNGGFSATAAGAGNGAGVFSLGGGGGNGASASTVTLDSSSRVVTHGRSSFGIFAQSLGGGGGNGAFSFSGAGASTGAVAVSIGGAGGMGGSADVVTLTNRGDVDTFGDRATGLWAQSVGGGGGTGSFAIAGSGAQTGSISFALGGAGGTGATGAESSIYNEGAITTRGDGANGIFTQSVGGSGGNGGLSLAAGVALTGANISGSVGGFGGSGGTGALAEVINLGSITVRGADASGILAQSLGGGGGHGGLSLAGSFSGAGAKNLGVAVGGFGGDGNYGGTVTITNLAAIDVGADVGLAALDQAIANAGGSLMLEQGEQLLSRIFSTNPGHGIQAQSVGGGGGAGGHSVAVGLGFGAAVGGLNLNNSVAVGGFGGTGNAGGGVTVANAGGVTTRRDDSHGILAQSIGGGGGQGGSAFTATVAFGAASPGRTINTSTSVGGFGGDGNIGGAANVFNSGAIATLGHMADGIRAQSVGGGGGQGGSSRSVNLIFGGGAVAGLTAATNVKSQVSVGGTGGIGSDGGAVWLENDGVITTAGAYSRGLFAQSIGGGGGSGGDGIRDTGIGILDGALIVVELAKGAIGFLGDLNVTVGGSAGASGDAADVTVHNRSAITTSGFASSAIFAQSVGGGGGESVGFVSNAPTGGDAIAGALGKVAIGGGSGAGGNGALVTVTNSSNLTTFGASAHGIFAQSVGGGGGAAGNVRRFEMIPGFNLGLPGDIARDGGAGGTGADVTVVNTGFIRTNTNDSFGIFAQSIGGGGGLASGLSDLAELLNFAGSVGAPGDAGNVTVTQSGLVLTTGQFSHGIFAQSEARGGMSGAVTLDITGDVIALGLGSHGIVGMSAGAFGSGSVSVTTRGLVTGGSFGSAVMIDGGGVNTLTNFGTILSLDGPSGLSVISGAGDETVENFGRVTGSVSLGSGSNLFVNQAGALLEPGDFILVGGGGLFRNGGVLSLGGIGQIERTLLVGDLQQFGTPLFQIDLAAGEADELVVVGNHLGGGASTTIDLNLLSPLESTELYSLIQTTGGGLLGDAFGLGSLFGPAPLGSTFELRRTEHALDLVVLPSAGTFVWTGAASDFWSTPFTNGQSNWARGAGDVVFGTPGALSDVVFDGGSTTSPGADFTIHSLTFTGGATTIAPGNALTLAGPSGITLAGGAATIGADLVLGTSQTWLNDSAGLLAISGARVTGGGEGLTIGGSGDTFIGAVLDSGIGSLTKIGAGTLFLGGASTYSGGTFVVDGVVIGDTTSLQGAIANDAIVAFDQAFDGTYAGMMSGSGMLIKTGAGALNLAGPNTYSGATLVGAGTLIGSTASLQGDIQIDSAAIFDQDDAGTFAGSLFGAGALTFRGGGAFTLSGLSGGFGGTATVATGQLFVDGSLGGLLTMQAGTLLGGIGIAPTTTIRGGATLNPGAFQASGGPVAGTLRFAGDLRFDIGSTFEVDAFADGSADMILGGGSASMAGGLVDVRAVDADSFNPITQYLILGAAGGITGAFDEVVSNASFLSPTLDYTTSELLLTLRRNDIEFRTPDVSGSASNVAVVFNDLVLDAEGPMAEVINHLFGLSDADAARAMQTMTGLPYQHAIAASLDAFRVLMDINLGRLGQPSGADGAGETGASLMFGRRVSADSNLDLVSPRWQPSPMSSAGWWMRGLGGRTRLDGSAGDPGARVPTYGLALGFDRPVSRALTLGVSGAYVSPHVYQDGGEDETAARVFSIGGYGRVAGGASRLDFGASIGRERFETRRSITDGVDFASSSSEYDGRSIGGQVEYGYTFGLGRGVDLEAETGLQLYRQTLEAIQEAGAGVLNLSIPEQRIESRRSLLGARLRKTIARASGTEIVFEGRGAWLHEFAGRADLPARFEGDLTTGGFRLPAPGRLRNNGLFGAGIYANTRGGLRFFADVVFESGPASRVSGSLGVGRRW